MVRYLNRITLVLVVLMGLLLFQKYTTTAMIFVGGYLLYRAFTGTNRKAIRTYKVLKRMERNLKSLHGIEMSLQELVRIMQESQKKQAETHSVETRYNRDLSSDYSSESPIAPDLVK